ncbi:MAG: hypothetical protein Q9220_006451 [cf. Caloplaca sp. 1 TL-2023]
MPQGTVAGRRLSMTKAKRINSELSTLVAQAKKAGLPKEVIERAIAKGKGVSLSGDPLQTLTLEAILPSSVSAIIECQTDNKKRTFEDLRLIIKGVGGTFTPTSHLFDRQGRITFESEVALEEEAVMEHVIEHGALDMQILDDQTSLYVFTEPAQTSSVAQSLARSLDLRVRNQELIWVPRSETLTKIGAADDVSQIPLQDVISMSVVGFPARNAPSKAPSEFE